MESQGFFMMKLFYVENGQTALNISRGVLASGFAWLQDGGLYFSLAGVPGHVLRL